MVLLGLSSEASSDEGLLVGTIEFFFLTIVLDNGAFLVQRPCGIYVRVLVPAGVRYSEFRVTTL